MRRLIRVVLIMGVLFLGASRAGAALLVFTDESSFLAALGGVVLTVEEPDGVGGNVAVTSAPQLAGNGVRVILWNEAFLADATSSLSSLIHVPAADLDDLGAVESVLPSASVEGGSLSDGFADSVSR